MQQVPRLRMERVLTPRAQRSLSWGLEARWLELWNQRTAGYSADKTAESRQQLIEDAREAHSLGLIAYLPAWAKDK